MDNLAQLQILKWAFYTSIAAIVHVAVAWGVGSPLGIENAQQTFLKISLSTTMGGAVSQPTSLSQEKIRKQNTSQRGNASAKVQRHTKYLRRTAPDYPRRALELGQEGLVIVHAQIMPNGKPEQMKVFASSGYRLLDEAAMVAIKTWEFESHNKAEWVKVPVRFVIQ